MVENDHHNFSLQTPNTQFGIDRIESYPGTLGPRLSYLDSSMSVSKYQAVILGERGQSHRPERDLDNPSRYIGSWGSPTPTDCRLPDSQLPDWSLGTRKKAHLPLALYLSSHKYVRLRQKSLVRFITSRGTRGPRGRPTVAVFLYAFRLNRKMRTSHLHCERVVCVKTTRALPNCRNRCEGRYFYFIPHIYDKGSSKNFRPVLYVCAM